MTTTRLRCSTFLNTFLHFVVTVRHTYQHMLCIVAIITVLMCTTLSPTNESEHTTSYYSILHIYPCVAFVGSAAAYFKD